MKYKQIFMNEGFSRGQERKREVAKTAENAASFKGRRRIFDRYNWVDSPIHDREDFGSFEYSFERVIPSKEEGFRNYVESTLKERKGKAIGIEFGGVGSRLFSDFTPEFFARSMGVTLFDHRSEENKFLESLKRDIETNHKVLEDDIFAPQTYESLKAWLAGEKADLIIERMGKGLEFVPTDPFTVGKTFQTWYGLLREGGIMFVQVPIVFNHLLEEWALKIDKKFPNTIEIDVAIGRTDNTALCSCFRLCKLPGAPDELPLLEPKSALKISKWQIPK